MKDMIVVIAVVIAFASFFTAHVAITYGLVFRHPRWRAPVGFFVPPLGLYWAWREHMRVRAGIAVFAFVLYIVANIIART